MEQVGAGVFLRLRGWDACFLLAFVQMVTLELLNQHKQENEENIQEEEEEEKQPESPSLEQSVSASSGGPSPEPQSQERQETPGIQPEAEVMPYHPPALPTPQDDVQKKGEPLEAETHSDRKDDCLSPQLTSVPGPPTSIPPKPPGPVVVDSVCEETLAASLMVTKPDDPLGPPCNGTQDAPLRLPLTSDPQEDPLATRAASSDVPQPPELKEDEAATIPTTSTMEPVNTEAGAATTSTALGPDHCPLHARCVPLSSPGAGTGGGSCSKAHGSHLRDQSAHSPSCTCM